MVLTAIQEDYLETIYRIEGAGGVEGSGVRATDIATRLGCRLPTVTRTVRRMAEQGFVYHESRGLIELTDRGRRIAENLAHRHADTVTFLVKVLGLDPGQAYADACQMEHGLSPLGAQRLHEFLEYIEGLDAERRAVILDFARRTTEAAPDFAHLPNGKTAGWRG